MELFLYFLLTISLYIPIFFIHGDWLEKMYISKPELNFSKLKYIYILVNPILLGFLMGLTHDIIFLSNINLILIFVFSIIMLVFSFIYFGSPKQHRKKIKNTYLLIKSLHNNISEYRILRECLYRRHPDWLSSNFLDDCYCIDSFIEKLVYYERNGLKPIFKPFKL